MDFRDSFWTHLNCIVGWKLKVSHKFVWSVFNGLYSANQHLQGETYDTLVLLYMLLGSEMRDSRNTFELECGLNSQSLWKVCFIDLFGSDTVKKLVSPREINMQV